MINKGRVVKGVNFVDLKDAGDPVEIAKLMMLPVQTSLFFLISLPPVRSVIPWWIW